MTHRLADDAGAFLDRCRSGSGAAYEAFKELLERLDGGGGEPDGRPAARRLLGAVVARLIEHGDAEVQREAFHVAARRLPAGAASVGAPGAPGARDDLTLLQLPGVFAPEEWSFTFFEGLARYPSGELEGMEVAELGCGNGWISLALARRSLPRKVYALDINPRAVACARLNLYLNGLGDDGEPMLDASGRSLLDRVEVARSDLLAWCRERGVRLDRVVGCIPQVLHPDLETTLEAVSETASDEFLYSLSNYTGKQGYIEDQFGLGLIARAVEESVELLRPAGRMVFNLGGRPGRGVLRRLFERRGVEVRELWSTTILQAGDTDILPLVEIEQSTPHRFEFFLGHQADEPVSATTAQAYLAAGGEISHALTVYEGRMRFAEATRRILHRTSSPGFGDARSALDLAYPDEPQAEEKTAFLAQLAEDLAARRPFPYGATAGSRRLRGHLAEYLRRYFGVDPAGDGTRRLLIAPSREAVVANLLDLYRPALAVIDPEIARHLPGKPAGAAAPGPGGATRVIEGVRRTDLTCRLIEALRPGLVVAVLADFETRSPAAFDRLVETAERLGCRLVVDISPTFELSSTPTPNGVLRSLSEAALPAHAAVLCGLVKNRVYRDLEVSFLLAEDRDLLDALAGAAEVTYSRTPVLAQRYYDVLVDELLSFRLPREMPTRPAADPNAPPERTGPGGERSMARPPSAPESRWPPLAAPARHAFDHPAMVAERLPIDERTVRFDYGENSLDAPDLVRESLFESFARQHLTEAELDPAPEIAGLLEQRFGLRGGRIVCGLGVADLFAALLRGGAAGGPGGIGTVLFPAGSYGFFVAAVELFGGRPVRVETQYRDRFKLTPDALDAALARELDRKLGEEQTSGGGPVWLFLNGPIVNPTGAIYTSEEIAGLLAVAGARGVPVILDTIFSGLELAPPATGPTVSSPWDPALRESGAETVILGGISKELAAGGIRFGWAAASSPALAVALEAGGPTRPHCTIRFAVKRMLGRLIAAGRFDPSSKSGSDQGPDQGMTPGSDKTSDRMLGGSGQEAEKARAAAEQLAAQRELLRHRAERLTGVLEACGWEVLPPAGGLFLVARPAAYLGRTVEIETDAGPATLTLNGQTIADALFWSERLMINGSTWTGIPEWCRFAFAVGDEELDEGLRRLRSFAHRVGGVGIAEG